MHVCIFILSFAHYMVYKCEILHTKNSIVSLTSSSILTGTLYTVSRSRLSLREYLSRRTLAGDLVGVTCSCRMTEYKEEIEAQSGMSAYAKLAPCS